MRARRLRARLMKWNKSTRLGLYAALEMARIGDGLVTVGETAARYGVSTHHLAKVFQQLARAGVARAVLGVGGGYRLAKPAKDLSLLDVVEVFEGRMELGRCLLNDAPEPCGDQDACRLKRVFDEIERQAFFTLKSIRLSSLLASGTIPV